MNKFIEKIIGNKKEWRAMEARAKTLPHDYQVVYEEIKQYIWKSSGLGSVEVLIGILDLFEEGTANNKGVLEITGNDVAAFCPFAQSPSRLFRAPHCRSCRVGYRF